MKIFNRKSHDAGTGKTSVTLRIAAVAGLLLAAPAIVHAVVPASLAVLQVVLDVCQFCVSTLRICGI